MSRWERSLGTITWTGAVRIDSDLYGQDHYGYVQAVLPGGQLQVRIEDPGQEHPAVRDMLADFPEVPYDHHEFTDTVARTAVRDAGTGETLPEPLAAIEAAVAREEAAEAARAAAERRAVIRAEIRSGKRPSAFPELRPLRSGRR